MSAFSNPYAVPVVAAQESERSTFLRKVGAWTFGGLMIAGAASLASMTALLLVPALGSQYVALGIMLGAIFASRFIGSSMVYSESAATRVMGFVAGNALQGIAMGYLLLVAIFMSAELYGNPLAMLGQAVVLVGLTVAGIVAYLLTGPKNLSLIGGALSALTLPMLGLMVLTAVWPVGGVAGVVLSVGFVAVSAGGLLFNLNQVMHRMSTDQVVPAAYHVSIGILVLFWNVLSLLMRLNRR
ncbi:MAG: Bax inhibitor-1 family protein [Alphaproteobacteria bacterium]|nr:Bax inhibitor-1 family protein [Alphaproteobacteria bacterium]MCB9698353.1 Bax inhibitor-1 family protein [Alphaproteobacteria bacterium]